jgi:hypothetical protein
MRPVIGAIREVIVKRLVVQRIMEPLMLALRPSLAKWLLKINSQPK